MQPPRPKLGGSPGSEMDSLLHDHRHDGEEDNTRLESFSSSASSSTGSATLTPRSTFQMSGLDSPRALEEAHPSRRAASATIRSSASSSAPLTKVASSDTALSSGSQPLSITSAINANRGGPALVSIPVNPHVGDPHFVGTIYDKNVRKSDDVEGEKGEGVYLRHVKALAQQWPRLIYLSEFMEAGVVPKKSDLLPALEISHRRTRVKVASIDFSNPNELQKSFFTTGEALAKGLATVDIPFGAEEKRNRLLIVEDLSSTTIEALGAGLDIDPTFFRDHLEDHTWFNIKDNWVEMPKLQSQLINRDFVNLAYMRPRFFEDESIAEQARDQAGQWNVQRRLDFEGQVRSGKNGWWEDSPHQVGLHRSKISIWSRQDATGWIGVILVDPLVTAGHPLWNGYGKLSSPPGLNAVKDIGLPADSSPFDTLISEILGLSLEKRQRLLENPEQITSHVYPLIFGEVLVTLEYSFTGLFQIEWLLDSQRTRHLDALEDCINSLHKWQRRLPFYVKYVEESIAALEGRYNFVESQVSPPSWQTSVRRDYSSLLTRFETLQKRADKVMQMAVSIISIEESKKAMVEGRNMGRITYLAFVFVPISFVTSFLSMNDNLSQRSIIVYCVFFAISVPLLAIALVTAFYWNQLMQWWETRQANKGKSKLGRS